MSCVNNPISVGIVFPTVIPSKYVVARQVDTSVNDKKLHAKKSCCCCWSTIVAGAIGLDVGAVPVKIGALVNPRLGTMIGPTVGGTMVTGGDVGVLVDVASTALGQAVPVEL